MINELEKLGLSENEAKVYAAMLELGPAAVMEIAGKAGINRPTAYFQIEALKKKGLVSTQSQGKKQLYIAESPDHLSDVLDHRMVEVSFQKEILSKILPELSQLYSSTGSRPQVRFFEGKEGLVSMQKIFLSSGIKEVMAITPLDDLFTLFPNHQNTYSNKRTDKGIKSKLIYSSSKGPILDSSNESMMRETRFVPTNKMPFSGDVTIFGNSVAISALSGQISGIVIEHPVIAESFRGFFNFLWEFASQFDKK